MYAKTCLLDYPTCFERWFVSRSKKGRGKGLHPGAATEDIAVHVCTLSIFRRPTYDSVDLELLWKVLTRAGVTDTIMRAWVRMDGTDLSGTQCTQGVVSGYAGTAARICAVSAAIFHFLRGACRGSYGAVQRGEDHPRGAGVPKPFDGSNAGEETGGTRAEGSLGDAVGP